MDTGSGAVGRGRREDGIADIEAAVAKGIAGIEAEARRAEIDTRIEIQEKSRKWASASLGLFLFAVGLLALFGIREIVNFREQVDAREAEIDARADELEGRVAEMLSEIRQRRDDLDVAADQFANDMEVVRSEFTASREVIAEIRASAEVAKEASLQASRLNERYLEVSAQLENIRKLQNSFFDLYVMYPGESADLRQLLARLQDAGFVVLPENILNVSVDRTEVIYYDASRPRQVEEVRGILSQLTTAAERPADVPARHMQRNAPRDLLLKIRAN